MWVWAPLCKLAGWENQNQNVIKQGDRGQSPIFGHLQSCPPSKDVQTFLSFYDFLLRPPSPPSSTSLCCAYITSETFVSCCPAPHYFTQDLYRHKYLYQLYTLSWIFISACWTSVFPSTFINAEKRKRKKNCNMNFTTQETMQSPEEFLREPVRMPQRLQYSPLCDNSFQHLCFFPPFGGKFWGNTETQSPPLLRLQSRTHIWNFDQETTQTNTTSDFLTVHFWRLASGSADPRSSEMTFYSWYMWL